MGHVGDGMLPREGSLGPAPLSNCSDSNKELLPLAVHKYYDSNSYSLGSSNSLITEIKFKTVMLNYPSHVGVGLIHGGFRQNLYAMKVFFWIA